MPRKHSDGAAVPADVIAIATRAARAVSREHTSDVQSVDDALAFVLTRPMATPREMGAAFDQFIAAAADLAGCMVQSRITPGLSGVTISWDKSTVPSRDWLRRLEAEIVAFGACSGLQVWFRRH
ncbi:MAG TPA: hypothetical protein VII69_13275 [Candidatus Eremiobacteraceae bacterium]